MLQKMKTLTSGGQKFMLLGADIKPIRKQFGQQRIELGLSFYMASAGRSDFTLF